MKRVIIVSGGNISDDFALAFFNREKWDLIIGVDSGIHFLRKQDIQPDHIVGDFDSARKEELDWFLQNREIEFHKFPAQKDKPDTQIAVDLAIQLGAEEIFILGATGTRMDHVMANICILDIPARHQIPCYIIDEHNCIYIKTANFSIHKNVQSGTYISLFAIGDDVKDLTLDGFLYPLKQHYLCQLDPIGVSNEITNSEGKVSFSTGKLLVIESKD